MDAAEEFDLVEFLKDVATTDCQLEWPLALDGVSTSKDLATDCRGLVELEEVLNGLDDVYWDEDWAEIERLCGADSLCCVQKADNRLGINDSERPGPVTRSRFKKVVREKEMEKSIVSRVPRNTSRSTNWGVRVFEDWCAERKIEKPLISLTESELNCHIARFVHEAVKKDGETPYPPNSLYQIVVSIQRYFKENGRPEISFFDHAAFDTLQKSLDARMKQLTAAGFGTTKRQAQPITKEMEALLWEKNIFSRSTGEGLMNIVYYYNCKFFGLRAGDKHRALCVEQFSFGNSEDGSAYMQFTGRSSKTYQGGLRHRKFSPKELKVFAFPELGERDVVDCFRYYISFIPVKGPFYRKPVKSAKQGPKFSEQVVGKNTLGGLVQRFEGFYTGHSGKVTCATELFSSMVDEQLIQHYTGHRSSESVRLYKRAGDQQFKQVSRILQPPPPKKIPSSFNSENDVHGHSSSEKLDDEQEETDAKDLVSISSRQHFFTKVARRHTPLEDLTNSVGVATIQAMNGGNITFNFNYH